MSNSLGHQEKSEDQEKSKRSGKKSKDQEKKVKDWEKKLKKYLIIYWLQIIKESKIIPENI